MYGRKRSSPASTPHSAGDGVPMKYSPIPMMTPKAALIATCVRK